MEVGETSAPQAVTLTNSGDADATGLTFNAPSSGFEADASLCGDTLPADGSCEVSVTFTPIVPGPIMATLTAASAEGASADLPLAGTGVGGGGGFTPMALAVDPEPFLADGNGVFEPGELVEVAPTWRNDDNAMVLLTGAASDFDGTDGGVYFVAIDDADYGNVEPGGTASCRGAGDTGLCYFLAVNDPAVRPATHWEASFDESLSDTDGTTKTWSLHIGESFTDVPRSSPFYTAIETLLHNGVTGGCTATEYCPTGGNTRGQMAVFLLKAVEGSGYLPPACEEDAEQFTDVPFDSPFCPWIEELAVRGITGGCSADPPAYCPAATVTRAQMAVFVTKTFDLTLYGP